MNVVDKILALRRLSENRSATAAEAANAAARVQELMLKHQITEASLGVIDQAVGWDRQPLYAAKKNSKWRTSLAVGIANLNGCKALRGVSLHGMVQITLVGRASDVEVVRYLYAFLEREIDRLAKEYLKSEQRPYGSGMLIGESYRLGCVNRVVDRLQDQKASVVSEARESGQQAALVLVDAREAAVEEWVSKNAPKRHAPKKVLVDTRSWSAGTLAADRISIHSAIEVQSAGCSVSG